MVSLVIHGGVVLSGSLGPHPGLVLSLTAPEIFKIRPISDFFHPLLYMPISYLIWQCIICMLASMKRESDTLSHDDSPIFHDTNICVNNTNLDIQVSQILSCNF